MSTIKELKDKVLNGQTLTEEEVYSLVDVQDKKALHDAAAEITKHFCKPVFDSCSIINARSGKCSENCKWCAQSAHYKTGCTTYDIVNHEECLEMAKYNEKRGVKRFSLVTSGRAAKGQALNEICSIYKDIKKTTNIYTCASLGLLTKEELQQLWDAGVRRYHCNLETAPSFFPNMCTTHTIEDKIKTIKAAKEIGYEVCSGGIIGMGETPRQRAEFALKLREVAPHSIPINILCPIKGTPLENQAPLTEEEVLDTIAIFRFAHPAVELRFAGGRSKLSREAQIEAIRIGINSGVTGDLLTTTGSTIEEDKNLVTEAGLEF
jgi:biotin synthase